MTRRSWTDDECSALEQMSKMHTIARIAEIFNRTIPSVRGKVKEMGLSFRKHREEQNDTALRKRWAKMLPGMRRDLHNDVEMIMAGQLVDDELTNQEAVYRAMVRRAEIMEYKEAAE